MMTKSNVMKGYYVPCGYMGYINGNYRLFATESEYIEVWKETKNMSDITTKYYTSTMFSGEIILDKEYATYEEAKENTNNVFPDVEWIKYNKYGLVVASSYGTACPWI